MVPTVFGRFPLHLEPSRDPRGAPGGVTAATRPASVTVVLADRHPVFRDGLRRLLEARDFKVLGATGSRIEAVGFVKALHPDLLILDWALDEGSGLDLLQDLSSSLTPVPAVVLSAAIGREDGLAALRLGARALIPKAVAADVLMRSLAAIQAGHYWIDEHDVPSRAAALREVKARPATSEQFGLTPRELEIIRHIAAGLSNRRVAQALSVTEDTVKHHLMRIFAKTRAANRVELAVFAIHHSLARPLRRPET